MPRFLKTTLLLTTLILMSTLACKPRQGAVDGNVILLLPESRKAPDYDPERKTRLTIDGKEEVIEPGVDREHSIKVNPGKTVTIVYDYWPKGYSNTIRTKTVRVEPGKTVRLDFHKEDADHPDKILPIYYPTPYSVADEMCKLAEVGAKDIVFDIGCGDGRLVIAAVKKFGAKKGVGIDISPDRIKECNENAKKDEVTDKVEFRLEDALKMKDLSDATVVLLYVGEDFGRKLEPVLRKTLKPGARVVSHRFPLGDWKEDVLKKVKCKNNNGDDEDYELKLWTIK